MAQYNRIHTVTVGANLDMDDAGVPSADPWTIDLAAKLSSKYGRMIRQNQVFRVAGIDISLRHQDDGNEAGGAASGTLSFYEPTVGRVKAVKHAFKKMQDLRKAAGIHGSPRSGYDFRVGLLASATTDWGAVTQQAELIEDSPLYLLHESEPTQSIFTAWNKATDRDAGQDPDSEIVEDEFGLLAAMDALSAGDEVLGHDHIRDDQEAKLYTKDLANGVLDTIPFSCGFASRIDDNTSEGGTNLQDTNMFMWRPLAPVPVLNGLIGVRPMSVMVDEAGLFGEDCVLSVSVHVVGWTPLMGSKNKGRRK